MAIGNPRRRWVAVHLSDDTATRYNPRLTRAYGEGRAGIPASGNPHRPGSPAYIAGFIGNSYAVDPAYKFEAPT